MNKLLSAVAIGAVLSMGAANAATVAISEGSRTPIPGSIDIGDASGSADGYDLDATIGNSLDAGDRIDLYGRIVASEDFYNFTASGQFNLDLIADGITVENGPAPHDVYLTFTNETTSEIFRWVATSDDLLGFIANSSSPLTALGAMTAGSYILEIDMEPDNLGRVALYDVQLSGVPVPAALPLFAAGLGLLGATRRKRRA